MKIEELKARLREAEALLQHVLLTHDSHDASATEYTGSAPETLALLAKDAESIRRYFERHGGALT